VGSLVEAPRALASSVCHCGAHRQQRRQLSETTAIIDISCERTMSGVWSTTGGLGMPLGTITNLAAAALALLKQLEGIAILTFTWADCDCVDG
jgi:hypothetical protein